VGVKPNQWGLSPTRLCPRKTTTFDTTPDAGTRNPEPPKTPYLGKQVLWAASCQLQRCVCGPLDVPDIQLCERVQEADVGRHKLEGRLHIPLLLSLHESQDECVKPPGLRLCCSLGDRGGQPLVVDMHLSKSIFQICSACRVLMCPFCKEEIGTGRKSWVE
jgi:hypothetical protein